MWLVGCGGGLSPTPSNPNPTPTDEICTDGTDNDGDGQTDCDDADCADEALCCPDGDEDGVCDSEDTCPEGDDSLDQDGDGVADACDPCPVDNPDDTDADGLCDSSDPCPNGDDADEDLDGAPCGVDCDDADPTVAPLMGDTSGDGIDQDCDGLDCEAVQLGATYYTVCASTEDWGNAEALCQASGHDGLATIRSAEEQDQIEAMMDTSSVSNAWIGLTDVGSEGVFYWTSGIALTYTNWAVDEPNNLDGFENCGIIEAGRDYAWNDSDCALHLRDGFVCETRCPDADDDGVCDDEDICDLGDDHIDIDIDGVPDACDICLGFDDLVDADGDSIPDGCDDCPNGDGVDDDADGYACGDECDDSDPYSFPFAGDLWGDGVDNDCDGLDCEAGWSATVYYASCHALGSWSEAEVACVAGGYDGLATIEDAAEQAKFEGLMASSFVTYAWFGLNDLTIEGIFEWSSGNTAGYRNWAPGEPNDFNGIEDCGAIQSNLSYQWNDDDCSRTDFDGFLCEKR